MGKPSECLTVKSIVINVVYIPLSGPLSAIPWGPVFADRWIILFFTNSFVGIMISLSKCCLNL